MLVINLPPANAGKDELSLLPPSKLALSNKKRKGVFYTPDLATQLLAEWAIQSAKDIVLEPSFGGCGFLTAAFTRLQKLGASHAEKQLYGCDTDTNAFIFLSTLINDKYSKDHFKQADFLTVGRADFLKKGADAIIGNPPYVSWHNMLPSQRNSALAINNSYGEVWSRKASLWTFFLVHSMQFMKIGGRMAWILPGSFMHADYSAPLRKLIANKFERTLAVLLEQRIFIEEGTEESTVVLLCEGFQQEETSSEMCWESAQGLPELKRLIVEWGTGGIVGMKGIAQASRLLAPAIAVNCYEQILRSPASRVLGALMKVRIGLVTGDNKFFVRRKSDVEPSELGRSFFQPVIARQAHFKGLQITYEDLENLENSDARCLLLDTSRYNDSTALKADLNTYPTEKIANNRTFAKRTPWHFIAKEWLPDAFFSCMNWYGPTLALNNAFTTCTNTVYRVNFTTDLFASDDIRSKMAVCLQSTFSQFSAELAGRICGSGALKLEPSDINKIAFLMPPQQSDASAAFSAIDVLLREGKNAEARQIADQFMIQHGLLNEADVANLEYGLLRLRKLRQGARHPVSQ